MWAALVAQLQTGEKVLSTCVCEIGLGSSFRCCVTTNAVAVAVSKTSARIVGAFRFTAARLYAEHPGQAQQSVNCQVTLDRPRSGPRRPRAARTPAAAA